MDFEETYGVFDLNIDTSATPNKRLSLSVRLSYSLSVLAPRFWRQ